MVLESMQIKPFTNGGGVIHKIKLDATSRTHYSIWFNADYEMIDAEGMTDVTHQAVRTVKKDGPLWNKLQQHYSKSYAKVLFDTVTHANA